MVWARILRDLIGEQWGSNNPYVDYFVSFLSELYFFLFNMRRFVPRVAFGDMERFYLVSRVDVDVLCHSTIYEVQTALCACV